MKLIYFYYCKLECVLMVKIFADADSLKSYQASADANILKYNNYYTIILKIGCNVFWNFLVKVNNTVGFLHKIFLN